MMYFAHRTEDGREQSILEHGQAVAARAAEFAAPFDAGELARLFEIVKGTRLELPVLVAAFYGYEPTMRAYKIAVEEKYRFFSFGDAMLILSKREDEDKEK